MAKRRLTEFQQEREDFARAHKTAEKQVLPFVRKVLAETLEPVMLYARTYGLQGLNAEALINRTVWIPFYRKIFTTIGVRQAKREYYRQRRTEQKASILDGFLSDQWTSLLRDYALQYSYNIRQRLDRRTVTLIDEALGSVYGLGLSAEGELQLFEKNVKEEFRKRSNMIARTEATTISNLGKELGARQWIGEQGGGGYKVWIGRITGERPTHVEANDTIVPMDDLFEVGGEPCERPGDVHLSEKERINCRCTNSYLSQTRYNAYLKRGRIVDGKLIGAS